MKNPVQLLFQGAVTLASRPLEPHDDERPVDAIVVLGTPLRPDGRLSLAGRERVFEGVRRYQEAIAPLLVFTGGAAHSAAEAPAMALRAEELGVPRKAILVEDRSTTTAENARFTAEILRSHGVRSVWIISQRVWTRNRPSFLRGLRGGERVCDARQLEIGCSA
ncbi:MAG: YdcF family protein [Myxococcales bacterium]|nr:YdcF family protein [Myxococcales bacterium]